MVSIFQLVYDTPSEVEKNNILHALDDIGNKRANLLYNAAELYFKDAMDIEFHKLIHDGLLELIDELMFKFNIKCVYLKCEDSSVCNYVPKYGPVSNLSIKEIYTSANSLSATENNQILTRLITDIIKNDSFDRRTIRMEDYFFFKEGK